MNNLHTILKSRAAEFSPVIAFDPATEKISALDLTTNNKELTEEIFSNTKLFTAFISQKLTQAGSKYLIGGYNETRELYKRSVLFDFEKKLSEPNENTQTSDEPRRLHLGIDIWGEAGTPVCAPLGGMVHSFAYNNKFGDYGVTIILQHQIEMVSFYTLYGHLSLADIGTLSEGHFFTRGQCFAHFGKERENGNWPPHLHFQIIEDLRVHTGDYPGVCKESEKEFYLKNCPDPDLVLGLMQYVSA
jgi:murein DD-endopeptidase MepM/ murein hydrolase activator NlpD